MNVFKSIGAVLAGMITIVVLSVTTDFVLEVLGIFPSQDQTVFATWMLLIALTYRSLYAVIGGYLTAAIAPNRPVRHATILGLIGLVLSIAGAFVMWDKGSHWYPVVLAITALPFTWFGGKLKIKHITKNGLQ